MVYCSMIKEGFVEYKFVFLSCSTYRFSNGDCERDLL